MTDLLSSLPGDIPGLLLRGSPVVTLQGYDDIPTGARGSVLIKPTSVLVIGWRWSDDPDQIEAEYISEQMPSLVMLDLTDPTGRAQAAAWANKATTYDTLEFIRRFKAGDLPSLDERCAMDLGMRFADMTPEQIDTLARLCLRLAGRAP